jgi:hypothetical protein
MTISFPRPRHFCIMFHLFKRLGYQVFVCVVSSSLLMISCKYEEGPMVSLRTKRNRIESTWHLVDYQVDGVSNNQVVKSNVSGDSIRVILNITASGSYCLEYEYIDKNKVLKSSQKGRAVKLFENSILLQEFSGGGVWSFIDKHQSIEMGHFDLSQNELKIVSKYKIVKLSQKELKISKKLGNVSYIFAFQGE